MTFTTKELYPVHVTDGLDVRAFPVLQRGLVVKVKA